MWSRTPRNSPVARIPRRAILLWATLISLGIGLIEFGLPLDNFLRTLRNTARSHPASGEVVIIAIDDRSIDTLDKWPWPRTRYAEIIDSLRDLGAQQVAFEPSFSGTSNAADDKVFEQALARFDGHVLLPAKFVTDPVLNRRDALLPPQNFRRYASLVNTNVYFPFWQQVQQLPYAHDVGGTMFPSMAAYLAKRPGDSETYFPIDYSIAVDSIPVYSAVDLISGKVSRAAIVGRKIIVGSTSVDLPETYFVPRSGKVSVAYIHALGAETLLKGRPLELGWLIPVIAVLAAVCAQLFAKRKWHRWGAIALAWTTLLGMPFVLESRLIFVDIAPGLALLIISGGLSIWHRFRISYKARGLTNGVSGLPNLNALREQATESDTALVAARIHNYAEIASALPQDTEAELVNQIVARLAIGARGGKIFQGDEGIFAWLANSESGTPLGDQLDALHALCRTPIVVAETHVDLSITFGIDAGSDRSPANRIGGALVAAEEAQTEGRRWKEFDAAKLKDVAWKLSLLGRLDSAIDAGELWVAYQPKIDLRSKRIIGAEALVRWSHAQKGEIGPADFIPAAEQSNRIDKLTAFVLESAIKTAADIGVRDNDMDVAVNLSARLLDRPDLLDRIEALLAKYRVAAHNLTLEVTESAAMTGHERSIEMLTQLRAMGVNISIDDYGTGFSTLDYLKKIPATEIKIDRSFVRMIDRSQSDRLMVDSTIHLAHSLGRTVVAEGVETPEILRALEAMGCDKAQGYLLGRPMSVRNLHRVLVDDRRHAAA